MAIDIEQFHQTFFEESFEGMDVMESELLNLDVGAADNETINTIFRSAHSMKGGSATFGFKGIADFTPILETLLDEMRDGRRDVNKEIVDVLLESVDCLREMMSATQNQEEYDNEKIEGLKQRLNTILGQENQSIVQNKADNSAKEDEEKNLTEWNIRFSPHEHLLSTGNEPLRIFRELSRLGELSIQVDTSNIPPLSELNPESCYLSWELILKGLVNIDEINEAFE